MEGYSLLWVFSRCGGWYVVEVEGANDAYAACWKECRAENSFFLGEIILLLEWW